MSASENTLDTAFARLCALGSVAAIRYTRNGLEDTFEATVCIRGKNYTGYDPGSPAIAAHNACKIALRRLEVAP